MPNPTQSCETDGVPAPSDFELEAEDRRRARASIDRRTGQPFPPLPFMAHHIATDRLLCITARRGNIYVNNRGYCYHPEAITADLTEYAKIRAQAENDLWNTRMDALR